MAGRYAARWLPPSLALRGEGFERVGERGGGSAGLEGVTEVERREPGANGILLPDERLRSMMEGEWDSPAGHTWSAELLIINWKQRPLELSLRVCSERRSKTFAMLKNEI